MIRKAVFSGIDRIEDAYNEHFQYETDHTASAVSKKGVYPTRKDAERAIRSGTMFVYEENEDIAGSVIADKVQPAEYAGIPWKTCCPEGAAVVQGMIAAAVINEIIAVFLAKKGFEWAGELPDTEKN